MFIKKVLRKAKNLIKRILGINNERRMAHDIEIIKNSNLFDENFYLNSYPDIRSDGIDPATHYYLYGANEMRNPSARFNTEAYIKLMGKTGVNPLVHCVSYMKKHPDFLPTELARTYVDDLLYGFFDRECVPLKTKTASIQRKHRLNIFFNGFDKGAFYGGKATALLLATTYCNKYNTDLRIIDYDPDPSVFKEYLEIFDLKANFDVSFYATSSNMYLDVDPTDDFLCTMWVNADSVLHTPTITGKIFYIMQEVETFFYDHGDYSLRTYNTLTDNRIIPIVNSEMLYDYLCNNGYNNVRDHGYCFEPVFSRKLLSPSKTSFAEKKKHKLFFYGRPSHQRDIFYFGIEVINEALKRNIIDPEKWMISIIGDGTVPYFKFDVDVELESNGVMKLDEYCKYLSTIDLCFSMIYTPHPSYPPLDAVSAGAVSLTNRYANKQDFSRYSSNIVAADLNIESMLDGMKRAVKLAENVEQRRYNYENETHTYGEWTETLSGAAEFMREKLEI